VRLSRTKADNAVCPKEQHWLPCVYLKEFSSDLSKRRKSEVWRFDGSRSIYVSVDSQCRGEFFYSKTCAKEAEHFFNDIETLYGGCVNKIKAGANQTPTHREYFGLILMLFDLHLRNNAQQNLTSQDNFEAYKTRVFHFLRDMLIHKSEGIPTENETKAHLHKHWRVRIIRPTPSSEFITSDNPTMIFSANDRHDCHYAILPISPDHIAVAFDERFVRILSDRTKQADNMILNKNQCRQALKCVYSREQLNEEQERVALKLLKEPRNHGVLSEKSVEYPIQEMAPGSTLSFIAVSACAT